MGKAARLATRRRERLIGEGGVQVGWCPFDWQLPQAFRAARNTIAAAVGSARGVTVGAVTAAEAPAVLDRLSEGASRERMVQYNDLRGLLAERGGWLVVTTVRGRRR